MVVTKDQLKGFEAAYNDQPCPSNLTLLGTWVYTQTRRAMLILFQKRLFAPPNRIS